MDQINAKVSGTGFPDLLPHSRVFLISALMAITAIALMVGTAMVIHGPDLATVPLTIVITAGFLLASHVLSLSMLVRLSRISVWGVTSQVLPVWFSMTILTLMAMLVLRLEYSSVYYAVNWCIGLGLLIAHGHFLSRASRLNVGVFTGTIDPSLLEPNNVFLVDETMPIPARLDAMIVWSEQLQDRRYAGVLARLAINSVPILPLNEYQEKLRGRVDLAHTDASALNQLRPLRRYAAFKRLSDLIMAISGLTLFLPLMLLVALLIRLETRGSPLFSQTRIGLRGEEFTMLKFRSMVVDAEASGAQFAAKRDARVTRIGKIIRKWRIDELPQLFNVLTGSMSIIGPRPEQKAFVDTLTSEIPLYPFRHAVRPGITGWAQVMQGYADDVSSTDIKLSYDLFYIKNLSVMMDFVILFKTLKTIFTGFGAR
ncbi:exopolysaccharide biosynthesis polyprenyl glycosylphosphotransferase [Alphaproteobacteria bacterium LSUCC0684]